MKIQEAKKVVYSGEVKKKLGDPKTVVEFFKQNSAKFETKRQASKYLNRYGKVWKMEHDIELSSKKR